MRVHAFMCPAIVGVMLLLSDCSFAVPPSPPLGVDGDIIDLPRRSVVPSPPNFPNRGFEVGRVHRGTPAAKMGLERGDIIISIDSIRFTSLKGLRHALACAEQRPSFIIVNVRNGQFVRRSVDLPHRRPDPEHCLPQPPDSYGMAIDLVGDIGP